MTTTTIPDAICSEILQILDEEATFLKDVETCATQMGQHPIGRAFPETLVRQLVSLRRQVAQQQVTRATLQTRLSHLSGQPQRVVRLSTLAASPELTRELQSRRSAVLQQTLAVQSFLKVALGQLGEANSVLFAVLESILGSATDTSRYDADGRPTPRICHVEGRRVA